MQMSALGVKWPPPPGWRQAIDGLEISDEQAKAFEAAKFVFSAKTIKRQKAQKVEMLRLMGKEVPPELLPAPQPPLSAKATRRAEKRARAKAKKAAKVADLQRKLSQPRLVLPKPEVSRVDPRLDEFLLSFQWKRKRMEVLRRYGPKCMCCGATPSDGAVMNVDHIKPRKTHPHLALDFDNLQVLCGECNHGKGNWDMTDWRKPVATDGPPWDEDEKQQVRHLREILRGS